jgi:hypothetical protein
MTPWSIRSPFRFRIHLSEACLASGNPPVIIPATAKACGPLSRMTATPEGSPPEERANMVSRDAKLRLPVEDRFPKRLSRERPDGNDSLSIGVCGARR